MRHLAHRVWDESKARKLELSWRSPQTVGILAACDSRVPEPNDFVAGRPLNQRCSVWLHGDWSLRSRSPVPGQWNQRAKPSRIGGVRSHDPETMRYSAAWNQAMARSDLLINLVQAGAQGNQLAFRRTLEAMLPEPERRATVPASNSGGGGPTLPRKDRQEIRQRIQPRVPISSM